MPYDASDRIGSGHSQQELNAARWWVKNRLTLRTLGYGALIGWSVLTWGYGLWTLFDAYALSYPKEQRYVQRMAETAVTEEANRLSAPAPLEPGGTTILPLGGTRQQVFAPVNNPNPLWWAVIQYRFRDGSTETPLRRTAVLPGEARLLTELGWEGASLRTPSLSIETTEWKRIDPYVTEGNYPAFKERHSAIVADRASYTSNLELEGKTLGQSTYTLRNPSGFSYRNVELLTLLKRGDLVVGINRLTLPSVSAGASQTIALVWPENPIGVNSVEVRPFISLLDPETFRTLPGT
jgi:hypothetical protein